MKWTAVFEPAKEGGYTCFVEEFPAAISQSAILAISPDVPGLVAEGRNISEAVEITQGVARKIVESCREHGDPLPLVFRNKRRANREFRIPVAVSWRK